MNPVLNTTLPIGNATASLMAPLPVQALDAAKPFEISIPNVALPTPTAPAPAQIAPGKMLKIEGVTPADVIPAHAIELLAASAMREESPVEVSAEENPAPQPVVAQTAKPVWAFERYLPANPTPVARFIKPQTDEAAPEGEAELPADTQNAQPEAVVQQPKAKPAAEVVVECAVAPAIETPEVAPIIATETSEGDAPVQRELKPAKKQAEVTTDIVTPQIAPVIIAPVAVAAPATVEAKSVTAPVATATPVARPLPAKAAATPAAETTEAVEIAAKPEAPVQRVIVDTKGQQAAPKAAPQPEQAVIAQAATAPAVAIAVQQQEVEPATEEPAAVVANPVAREALPVWSRPASPKLSKADGYAFVRTSVKAAAEAPVSVKETATYNSAPVLANSDVQAVVAQTDTPAQILPVAKEASLAPVEGFKVANPLAELSSASHVARRHLDLARDTQWLDGLARDIVAASDRSGNMSFRLSPAHLGELDVALATSDAGLSVTMKTSSDEAAKIVHAAQPALVDTIQSQGVRVADAQVMSQPDMSRHGQSQPQRQPQASFIETGFAASTDTETQNDEQPRGRFA